MERIRWVGLIAVLAILAVVGAGCAAEAPTPAVIEKEVIKEVVKEVVKEVEKPEAPPVKIMAVYAQSGRWSFNGSAMLAGIRTAVNDINRAGGIKALGGAKLVLVTADAGDTSEKAGGAVARLLGANPDVVAGFGCWLSSFTLTCTEVSERDKLPWLTISYSDAITTRGFKYVFDTSPPATKQAALGIDAVLAMAQEKGVPVTKTGYMGDNTAAAISYRQGVLDTMNAKGIPVLVDEVFTPPLVDATPIVEKVRTKLSAGDIVWTQPTNFADVALFLQKLAEFRLNVLVVLNGAHALLPEYRQLGDVALGFSSMIPHHPTKRSLAISEHIAAESGYEFVWQDQISAYMNVWILKEAIERAGRADREAIAQQLRTMEVTSGVVADIALGGRIKFDATGRREGTIMALVQWQNVNGVLTPCTIWPKEEAACTLKWPGIDRLK